MPNTLGEATVSLGDFSYKEAIEYFQNKLLIPSDEWNDLIGPIHAKAFTVAGATKLEVLSDFYKTIERYIREGGTPGQFVKELDRISAEHGWPYKGNRLWRARIILNTNKRHAYAAGRWAQFQRQKERRPYLIYMTVGDERVRDSHRKWHMFAAHIDDPIWETIYPPNGWECRCYVRSATQRDLDRLGIKLRTNTVVEAVEEVDPKTGEIYLKVPGIDRGFEYNVGKAWLAPDVIFGHQLMEAPKRLRAKAIEWFDNGVFDQPYKVMFDDTLKRMASGEKVQRGLAQTVGYLSEDVIEHLQSAGLNPIGAAIVVREGEISHWLRDAKSDRGASVPISIAAMVPEIIRSPDVVLRNGKEITYAKKLDDGRYAKFVLKLNFKTRLRHNKARFKEYINTFVTAGIVQASNLKESKYVLISGSF